MTFWVAGAVVGSSVIGASASNKAARTQAAASDRAAELQNQQFQQNFARQKPFYDVGVNALPELVNASKYTNFGMDQFRADPGYAFRLSEGTKALERSAAARGGLLSGGTGKALQRFGQELGSQEYNNAFNRYQLERTARLQPLQSLTGMGQTTAQQIGAAGQNMASNVGDAIGSSAAARASGYVGQANALTGGLNTYLNYNQGQNMVNAMRANQYGPNYGQYTPGSYNFVGPMPG
jgi:hypothetical protein